MPALATVVIGLVHWNPHWQCFDRNPACTGNATAELTALLSSESAPVDFANIIELEDAKYAAPAGWASVKGSANETCGDPYGDWDTLYYRTDRWEVVKSAAGCLVPSRSFAAGVFKRKGTAGGDHHPHHKGGLGSVTVFGAHFPQTLNASTGAYDAAAAAVKAELQKLGWNSGDPVAFLADTNTESPESAAANKSHNGVNRTNGQLFSDIGVWSKPAEDPPGAKLFNSCCYSDAFSWQGDRVLANFGKVSASAHLFDPAPEWASFAGSEFHKGIRLQLTVAGEGARVVERSGNATCGNTSYCCPDAKKCVSPFHEKGCDPKMADELCGIREICCPLTQMCVIPGADCVAEPVCGADAYCCPDAKKCATPVKDALIQFCDPGDKEACSFHASAICCPLIKQCVTLGAACDAGHPF